MTPASTPQLPSALAPFLIAPQFVERIWGSTDLRPWFDHIASPGHPIGEVWLTGDDCQASTGPCAGLSLAQIFAAHGPALLGPAAPDAASPLLLKVLFAQQKLSVQVHPDDAMAQRLGFPRGKTECWYALAAEPGAAVACGLVPGTTLEELRIRIADGSLEQSLQALSVHPQELIYVDAGTVHAIWPGSVLLETQQNCDLTYRMFDYGRPRELHLERSLEATRFTTRAGKRTPVPLPDREILVDEDYFRMERLNPAYEWTRDTLAATTGPSLAYLFVSAGSGRITGPGFAPIPLTPRSVVALPTNSPDFTITSDPGLELIRITPHWPAR